jgi:hypothetical protein
LYPKIIPNPKNDIKFSGLIQKDYFGIIAQEHYLTHYRIMDGFREDLVQFTDETKNNLEQLKAINAFIEMLIAAGYSAEARKFLMDIRSAQARGIDVLVDTIEEKLALGPTVTFEWLHNAYAYMDARIMNEEEPDFALLEVYEALQGIEDIRNGELANAAKIARDQVLYENAAAAGLKMSTPQSFN